MTTKDRLKYYLRYFSGKRSDASVLRKSFSGNYISMISRLTYGNNRGGAFGIVIIGIAVSLAAFLAFVNAADFAIYSYKRSVISRSIDYSVSAAVQEIDVERSRQGLAEGFDGSGNIILDNVFIHEQRADNAFFSTFKGNTGLDRDKVDSRMLIAIVNPVAGGLNYIIKSKDSAATGQISNPVQLEAILNARVDEFWNISDPETDRHIIYVNGNLQTNEFKKRPYYMIFMKDYEIDGLFKRRSATFVGFKGAKVERKKD